MMENTKSIYSSTFIFAKGQYDDEFYMLDAEIAELAKSIPGYIGEERWVGKSCTRFFSGSGSFRVRAVCSLRFINE